MEISNVNRVAVADTGFVVALLNRQDRFHSAARRIYERQNAILLPQTTLTEIDFVDATVMALAERYGCQTILTLDRRDFQIFCIGKADGGHKQYEHPRELEKINAISKFIGR